MVLGSEGTRVGHWIFKCFFFNSGRHFLAVPELSQLNPTAIRICWKVHGPSEGTAAILTLKALREQKFLIAVLELGRKELQGNV